jgi:hypothetical protein
VLCSRARASSGDRPASVFNGWRSPATVCAGLPHLPTGICARAAGDTPARQSNQQPCTRDRLRPWSGSAGVVAFATGLIVVRLRWVRVDLWIARIAEGEPVRRVAAWPGGVDEGGVVAKLDSFLDAGEVLAEEELC